jgi:hypothetical protein
VRIEDEAPVWYAQNTYNVRELGIRTENTSTSSKHWLAFFRIQVRSEAYQRDCSGSYRRTAPIDGRRCHCCKSTSLPVRQFNQCTVCEALKAEEIVEKERLMKRTNKNRGVGRLCPYLLKMSVGKNSKTKNDFVPGTPEKLKPTDQSLNKACEQKIEKDR